MFSTRVSIFTENRLFADALTDILRTDASLVLVPRDRSTTDIDVAIVDARSGHSAARLWPGFQGTPPLVIFVGAADEDDWAVDALAMGARGILTRSASRDDLVKAIGVVRQGGIWACRRWLNARVQRDAQRVDEEFTARTITIAARLSPREEQVFRYAASGAANKELAQRLAISEATVKVHLTRIFQKLGVSGRAELAAVYYGLRAASATPPPQPQV